MDIQYLKGVGQKRADLYHKLNIHTVFDLICHFPRNYIDYTNYVPISQAEFGETFAVRAAVINKMPEQRIRKGLSLYKVRANDGENDLTLVFFNSKFAADGLKQGEEYIFYGKVSGTLLHKEMNAPLYVPAGDNLTLSPVYPLTEGLSNKMVSQNVRQALQLSAPMPQDPIPAEIRKELKLCHIGYAYENIHFPNSPEVLAIARRRLIFQELLTLQLGLAGLKDRTRETTAYQIEPKDLSEFYYALPFVPTNAQHRAIHEAIVDMSRQNPMNRLLQGDVGSGKTLVAAALAYHTCKSGYQTALMAPTEILATQHYHSLSTLLKGLGVSVSILTGSTPPAQKQHLLGQLKSGELDLIIGTHALLEQDVAFSRLALVITDEQHRFGVTQRSALALKSCNPHVLVMSATPIPRTLALMIYGDLELSVLDELPPGRQVVKTYLIDSAKRSRAYGFIDKHIQQGRQAYIVCPMIEEGELALTSATEYAKQLSEEVFAHLRVGLLHGKMKASQKDAMMASFQTGTIDILVSTTVIEVGVDVPNAVIMMIENAERFGLSQLHQLRGRVGRGQHKSYCILVSDSKSPQSVERLGVMCKTTDGFVIAEEDLRLRGPGDFFGQRQHGLPELKIADLLGDIELLSQAQHTAKEIIKSDPDLIDPQNQGLRQLVDQLFASTSGNYLN